MAVTPRPSTIPSSLPAAIDPAMIRAVNRPLEQAATLPRPVFSDPEVYAAEIPRLFHKSWTCVGRADDVAEPGSFVTHEIGGSGIVVLRDREGKLHAFHNVCRHRGTRLVEEPQGQGRTNLQCPYHAWTYDLAGRLRGAPLMAEIEEFEKEDSGLLPVGFEEWRGFLFANLNPHPEPLREYLGGLSPRTAPYPFERLRRAHRVVYEIAANWKLVVQNANECYHCPGVHPQLVKITPYTSGEEDLTRGPVFGGWMDFVPEARTGTMDGTTRRAFFPGLSADDRRRVYYYVLYPSNFVALFPDYVTFDWFIPLGPERTRLVFDLFVDRDEKDPADDAMAFWEMTNRQDWHICELAQLGARTVGYTQGRYSSQEDTVHRLDRHYLERMGFTASAL